MSEKIAVKGDWLVHADRAAVYAIISDFERMPEHFPRIAHAMKLLKREGQLLTLEAQAASFGKYFPKVKIKLEVELLPDRGYRCQTHNLSFNTRGDEELLLSDAPEGTRIEYTYYVALQYPLFLPLYAWLTRKLALPFWKHSFIDRLEEILNPQPR
ncbi:hypothetical protein COW36_12850 [bacterium (Candidatus Blackallbacteria) CG17_big_fil_post_rev_8_21_14_2_50_48_46]|uniref:Coenzyme Q-binding protein COQ10 START domain-containing protein n=1 Tax=bacterium (Candidatus Blackallbacteria) CG17_big_fil_post_rev_8_21_14_2_50_48_46 TaxID=2014261 RepID=A0A2M7G433_9BACT|nr:MAG: hypothetical protein COW64_02415 [bacterium (Candidatus Blackallbacteria) CG18_big_fil_WC_8_21_14_2_50_49_26]PIW16648.1 MAG: hypothetical protein COW36_12850 [bacterium (Candidatus Blackallbacteria) CG17_big_fil_post_rev_8_21_14_2_50_48_46]PIW46154.1 MAG: hypothetical protein COW20_18105 [bacterium (Candidatus Blackallbacteria) CG13_big_fil_rev_8_21_14_2_50_49_14]